MGSSFDARCKECGHVSEVSEGGGFEFDMLHCEICGKPEGRHRGKFALASEPAPWGQCSCGGALSRNAPSRCPKCRSTELEPLGNFTDYD